MTTSAEPPSNAFPNEAGQHCAVSSTTAQADRSAVIAAITALLNPLERIHCGDSREVRCDTQMRRRLHDCLMSASPHDAFPLDSVAREAPVVAFLTAYHYRPDALRLVSMAARLLVSIRFGRPLRALPRKHAGLGLLCDRGSAANGLGKRERPPSPAGNYL